MFCILRTKKIKSNVNINLATAHNLRLRHQGNIDKNKSCLNIVLINALNADLNDKKDFQYKLQEFYDNLKIKQKTDNVLMMEFVVSASPEFFENECNTEDKIKEWANSQVEFFKNEYGTQLKMAVIHRDEKTPHIHFSISTELKSIKKYKNQLGEFHKETYSLNAKRYDPEYLIKLHDRFSLSNQKFGLIRGKRNSKKIHKPVKEYYNDLAKIEEKITGYDKFQEFYPKLKQTIIDYNNSVFEMLELIENSNLDNETKKQVFEISGKFKKFALNSQNSIKKNT